MNLLEFDCDRRLGGQGFYEQPTALRWRVAMKALEALPMTDDELAIFREHTGRTIAPAKPFNEALFLCGRRSGKSYNMARLACYYATVVDHRPWLAPGERARIFVICPDRRAARVVFDYIVAGLRAAPATAALIDRESSDTIELSNRVSIEVSTCSAVSVRGYACPLVIADEMAFWSSETSAEPDVEVLNALRPTQAQFPHGKLLMISSPSWKHGVTYALDTANYGRDDSDVLVWKAATTAMNPTIRQDVIDRALALDPDRAASEWLGMYRASLSAAFPREWIEPAIDVGVTIRAPVNAPDTGRRWRYRGFMDAAGGSGGDSFTAGVSHPEGDVLVLDALVEIKPPFDTDNATRQIADLFRRYGISTVRGDRYAGDWPAQALAKLNIGYTPSELTKSQIYVECVPMFSSGRVRLLDNDRLVTQLRQLERRVRGNNRDMIDHPRGGHDDLSNSACGALWAASRATATRSQGVHTSHLVTAAGPYGPQPARAWTNPADRRIEDSIGSHMDADLNF